MWIILAGKDSYVVILKGTKKINKLGTMIDEGIESGYNSE